MPLSLHKINISSFRSYDTLRLDFGGASIVVLTGPNGAGKTNILEAVSLLAPGKGLRGADLLDMKSRTAAAADLWAVSADLETATGVRLRIGTGLDRAGKRRVVRINGADAKTQSELSQHVSAVWLTPQMDRLFQDGPSARRKFIDRLVFAYDPDHVSRLNRYDRNLRERMKLLQDSRNPDSRWMAELETQLAADGIAVSVARTLLIDHLHYHARTLRHAQHLFPSALLAMRGSVENDLAAMPAVEAEERLKTRFAKGRALDRDAGKSLEGPHRSDLHVLYEAKGMEAAECSTGEQKSLLVSVILAHAQMMQAEKGHTPLLLLDEVAAHLDDARRAALFDFLTGLQGQVFLTGTSAETFSSLRGKASFFAIGSGHSEHVAERIVS